MELITTITGILCLPILILLALDYYKYNNRRGKYISKIPGPKYYPLIGNALDIMVPLEQLWHFFRMINRDYYPVAKFWIINWPVVNISHPDDIEIILSSPKNIEKNLFYELLHPWLKEGLLTSKGDKWRSRRKTLTPAFHFNVLQEFVETIVEHTENLIKTLQSEAQSGEVVKELLPMLSKFTLHTICETAMGVSVNKESKRQDKYRKAVYDIGEIFYYRAVRPWIKNDWIFSWTAKGREQAKSLDILHGFSSKIIEERKQYHEETGGKYLNEFSEQSDNQNEKQFDNFGTSRTRRRLAFLDLLISASKKNVGVDDAGIREEVDTFVFEGHDTTAMGLFFGVLLLAEHKDIQQRAREEVNEVLSETNGKITMAAINKFSYLERCIKESLRLYPSVPAIGRKITEDLQLKHCFVPAGSLLNIHIFDTHRNPNFWTTPNIYDPDRFLPERSEGRHPFSFVPFSAGPRGCIGQKFAMLELKTALAGLLHNFYLEPMEIAANIRMLPDLVIRCAHPVHCKFVPIKK